MNLENVGRILVLLIAASACFAQQYRSIETVSLPGAKIAAMNNSGDVTGTYCDQDCYHRRGFLQQSSGAIETFDGEPRAINDAGTVAGLIPCITSGFSWCGFLRSNRGIVTTFGVTVSDGRQYGTFAMTMNNREEIAGFYSDCYGCDAPNVFVAIRSRNGTVKSFQIPFRMVPTGINARGSLIGYLQLCCDEHGFLVDRKGAVTETIPPQSAGPVFGYPVAINNSGEIAGYFQPTEPGPLKGFLRDRKGTYTVFDGRPIVMNERGDIVGSDNTGGFFLRDAARGTISPVTCPVPFPDTISAMNNRGDVAGGNVVCSTR